MKLDKFAVIMAVLLMAILAIGAVSAESIDSDTSIAADGGDSGLQLTDDSAEDLSAADTISDVVSADEDANDMGSAVLTDDGDDDIDPDVDPDVDPDDPDEETIYQVNNDNYATYFNEDGTPTAAISADGDYKLQIGVLDGKNITINSGKDIIICPYFTEEWDDEEEEWIDVGGEVNGVTITIGPSVESIVITGLTFHNENQDAIIINGATDVTIDDNVMFVETDSGATSIDAILLNGAVSDIIINDNGIFMRGSSAYLYGINLMCYGAMTNPTDIEITNNRFEIEGLGETGMVEAIYLSDPVNTIVEGNSVVVSAVNDVLHMVFKWLMMCNGSIWRKDTQVQSHLLGILQLKETNSTFILNT